MKCERIQQWILLEHSGELSFPRRSLLHLHLKTCAACRGWQTDSRLLLGTPLPEMMPPAHVIDRIMAQIPSGNQRPCASLETLVFKRRLVLAACAAAVMFVVGGTIWLQQARLAPAHSNGKAPLAPAISSRCEELSALALYLVGGTHMDKAIGPHDDTVDTAREMLARQILILQEMDVESGEDADFLTLPAEPHLPKDPQAHNSPEVPPERCV